MENSTKKDEILSSYEDAVRTYEFVSLIFKQDFYCFDARSNRLGRFGQQAMHRRSYTEENLLHESSLLKKLHLPKLLYISRGTSSYFRQIIFESERDPQVDPIVVYTALTRGRIFMMQVVPNSTLYFLAHSKTLAAPSMTITSG